jgi:nucleoside-diphosphate-sugar epimerase
MENKNSKIVILAANSQLGIEVCLYLSAFENLSITGVVRTEVAGALLKRLNIEYKVGELDGNSEIEDVISNADLVFDLAAPTRGLLKDKKMFYQHRLSSIFKKMKKGSTFVLASTQAAFGYKEPLYPKLKYYFFPRSVYAANKRYAEKLSKKLGKKNDIDVYLFRLADVYGITQKSTARLRELIAKNYSFTVTNTPANTIFTYEIALALMNIINRLESPGLYTMVSNYAWTYSEILEYIASIDNLKVKINSIEIPKKNSFHYLKHIKQVIQDSIIKRRDFFMANFSTFERFIPKLKHSMLKKRAEREIALNTNFPEYRGLIRLSGVLPGRRFSSLPDLRKTIGTHEKKIMKQINDLL